MHDAVEGTGAVVVGLGGSTRSGSRALEALSVALRGAARAGTETRLLDVRELSLPVLDADRPGWEFESVRRLLAGVRQAHGLIVASPVYQETISGALKNALDYLTALELEDPPGLSGKVIGLVSVSGGLPGAGASLAMQIACKGLGGWVLSESEDLGGTSFDLDGKLCDLLARDRLLALGRRVALAALGGRAEDRRAEDQVGAGDRRVPPYS